MLRSTELSSLTDAGRSTVVKSAARGLALFLAALSWLPILPTVLPTGARSPPIVAPGERRRGRSLRSHCGRQRRRQGRSPPARKTAGTESGCGRDEGWAATA